MCFRSLLYDLTGFLSHFQKLNPNAIFFLHFTFNNFSFSTEFTMVSSSYAFPMLLSKRKETSKESETVSLQRRMENGPMPRAPNAGWPQQREGTLSLSNLEICLALTRLCYLITAG